jgi:rare lipoprotein A
MEHGGRPGAALLLCGTLLIAPLVLLHGDPTATPPPHRAGTASGALASSARSDMPSWELASQNRPSAGAAAVTASAPVPPAATPTTVAPTTTTTAPAAALPATDVADRSVSASTTTEPTTTTTAPPAAPLGSAHSGQVTYYAHPAGTCASPYLPFGTVVRVTNPANGASVTCLVNDREADTARSIDLATATFAELAPLSQGVINAQLSW